MSAGIKALNYGSEICREWAASVKRTPLKKDVLRCVTVVKDGTVRTMGKINEFSFVEKTTPDGVKKIVTSTEGGKGRIKFVQYPNGSWYETTYNRTSRPRTNGEFVVKKKNGLSVKIGYGLDGEYPPDRVKGFFASSLKRLGEPKYDVNLREIFSDIEKTPSRVKKAITHVMDKVTTFLARYNKTNRTWRKLARSFDIQG